MLSNPKTLWSLAFLISLIWSLFVAGIFQQDLINLGGIQLVGDFLTACFSPELSREFLHLTLNATLKTLAFAVCGTFFSLIIGLLAGLFASEVWWCAVAPNNSATPWLIMRGLLAIPRSIHEAIWGLFLVNIIGLNSLVGILGIAIPFGAITAKVFSEILDETPRHVLLALLNNGVAPLPAFLYSLFPQAFLNLLSYSFYRLECAMRAAAVLGIIGAGGLGYEIFLSMQSLNYRQVWTLLIALVILTGSTDLWSSALRHRLGAPSRLDININRGNSANSKFKIQSSRLRNHSDTFNHSSWLVKFSVCLAIILVILSFWSVRSDFSQLWSPRTLNNFHAFTGELFPPNFTQLGKLFSLAQRTFAMSILAITFAGLGGVILSFPAASNFLLPGGLLNPVCLPQNLAPVRNLLNLIVLTLTRVILLFARAIPEPIWALLFLFILFPGILPGAIALGLHNLGILGRLMAEVIENLDQRPLRSLSTLGATGSQIFCYGVVPLTLPRFLAYILYRWEVCIRTTVIVGLVGAGGLGRLLKEQLTSLDYPSVLTTLLMFIVLTLLVDIISSTMRGSLR
ncbi:MAG: ABC transporter permease subunit [Okeania sp. SIO2D1]|nr:ABC transporter permease subunit [Okeania sp. SIO2D1]